MSVKRFVGPTSRDAMRLVRAALGENALILSNRSTPEGVEILAMADETHSQLTGIPSSVHAECFAQTAALSAICSGTTSGTVANAASASGCSGSGSTSSHATAVCAFCGTFRCTECISACC